MWVNGVYSKSPRKNKYLYEHIHYYETWKERVGKGKKDFHSSLNPIIVICKGEGGNMRAGRYARYMGVLSEPS